MCVGPRDADVALVGEAPGEAEWQNGMPFIGVSGFILDEILRKVGLRRDACFITNVFTERPPGGDVEKWLVGKKEADLTDSAGAAPVARGKYLHPSKLPHVYRLHQELLAVRPKLVICLGNLALWGVQGVSGLKANRGVMMQAPSGYKVITTYHPVAIAREYPLLPVAVMDFKKGLKYLDGRKLEFRPRRMLINPTIQELRDATTMFLSDPRPMGVDIETKAGQITCVGFGRPEVGITFPFWDGHATEGYFGDNEIEAWLLVQRLLLSPIPKVFQNGLYDIQYMLYTMGLRVERAEWDTMLMHHAMEPELQKGLGFLASLHLDEPSWKFMRQDFARAKDQIKKDD